MSLSHAIRVIVKSVLISKDIILYIYTYIYYLSSFKANKYLDNNLESIKSCQIMLRNCNKIEIKWKILIYQWDLGIYYVCVMLFECWIQITIAESLSQ